MSSLKRKRTENTADIRNYLGKENSPPRTALSGKDRNDRQPLIRPSAFGERSSNLIKNEKIGNKENRGSEVSAHPPHLGVGGSLIRQRSKEKSENQDPNQLLQWEKNILGKNHGTPSPPRVDNYFLKTYKNVSPTKKRENTEMVSSKMLDELCVGVDCLSLAPDIKMILLERSKSVCKIDITGAEPGHGTGFVLVDNVIVTCAHVFRGFLEGKKLKEGIKVSVLFNFHDPQPVSNNFVFTVEKIIVAINEKLDCVFLKLKPNPNQKVPSGLLEQYGPVPPENGKIFIIGHPRGEAKKMNFAFIIELENREQAIRDHLSPHKDSIFIRLSIIQIIEKQGIQDIMISGVKANEVETYSTTMMFKGASGSPVLNADGQLTLMHTGGYGYGFPHLHTVLEYGQRLDLIIQDLVCQLKESGNVPLLERIEFVASKNEHLKKVLEAGK